MSLREAHGAGEFPVAGALSRQRLFGADEYGPAKYW